MESIDVLLKAINREIINPLITLAFALTLVYFIYGVIKFIIDKQNGKDDGNGRRHMLWGLIGMFVMVSVFGIMQFIVNTLTLDFDVRNPGDTSLVDPSDSLGAGPGPGDVAPDQSSSSGGFNVTIDPTTGQVVDPPLSDPGTSTNSSGGFNVTIDPETGEIIGFPSSGN
jgi:hypothetical protein